ncbi:hypothetical protein [Parashewanella tropica]|uniref:hypothetical protein n=1 Tax=Parashewanella tropica TaxID=2547970 RepID=UPI00105A211D|nr:hypothetical protein [Parashewanella tropica]
MKSSVTLDPTYLCHDELINQWLDHHPQLTECYLNFTEEWPDMLVVVNRLSDLLSCHLKIFDYSLFELCLTNGLISGTQNFKYDAVDPIAYCDSLCTTAASALKGFYIRNQFGFEWSILSGLGLSQWLSLCGNNVNELNKLKVTFEDTAISLDDVKNKIKKQLLCC